MCTTKVINIFGGPGVGKSTVATGVFSTLKQRRISCEYVSEYAKEITWENTHSLLDNQVHVFAEQFRRQWRLMGKVSYIITDSPLLLSAVYFDKYSNTTNLTPDFKALSSRFFIEAFKQYDNINYTLTRVKPYDTNGRNQTLGEAQALDNSVTCMLDNNNIEYTVLTGLEDSCIEDIVRDICEDNANVN